VIAAGPGVGEEFFSALAQPGIRRLRAYDPGHDLVALRRQFAARHLVELGSNENPYGPSPRAREAVLGGLHALHRYPDPLGGDLRRALAGHHGVDVANIVLGNGSHELLMQFAQVFAGPDVDVVASQYGFAVYAIAAQAAGANLRLAQAYPRERAMARGHDLDALFAAITPATRLLYLANPNNPTGTWFAADAFASFMASVPRGVIVVVDEAYAELVDAEDFESALQSLPRHPNLVVTRTFSKAYALAGMRIGYALAHPGLVAVMERVRESFNVNHLALAAAEAALGDHEHLHWVLQRNREERARLAAAFSARGCFVYPSQTNFLLVEFGARTQAIEAALLAEGIVLRPMAGYGLADCLRITVGERGENTRLLEALDRAMA
jgi:histidinol-phosphate aminotransferase